MTQAENLPARGAYGRNLADAFKVKDAPTLVSRKSLNRSAIGVTELRCDTADNTLTSPVVEKDAFLLMLQLRDWPRRHLWADSKPVKAAPLAAGAMSIFDLSRSWVGHRVCPIHQLNFYLPRKALDMIADLEGVARVGDFRNDPLQGAMDEVVYRLGLTLLPAMERSHEANDLFVDHVTTALGAHIVHRYGQAHAKRRGGIPRLSRTELKISTDLLGEHLDGRIGTADLARLCGMTPTEFSRAFARTTGKAPHMWLLERRVEQAMGLLRATGLDLEDVALASGFSDEQHLARVFLNFTGLTPTAWRASVLH